MGRPKKNEMLEQIAQQEGLSAKTLKGIIKSFGIDDVTQIDERLAPALRARVEEAVKHKAKTAKRMGHTTARFLRLNAWAINVLTLKRKFTRNFNLSTERYFWTSALKTGESVTINGDWQGLSYTDVLILSAVWSVAMDFEPVTDCITINDAYIRGDWRTVPAGYIYEMLYGGRWDKVSDDGKRRFLQGLYHWSKRMQIGGRYDWRDGFGVKSYVPDGDVLYGAYKMRGTASKVGDYVLMVYADVKSPLMQCINGHRAVMVPDEMLDYASKMQSERLAAIYIAHAVKCGLSDKCKKMGAAIRLHTLRKAVGRVRLQWIKGYMEHLQNRGYIGGWAYEDGGKGYKVITFKAPKKHKEHTLVAVRGEAQEALPLPEAAKEVERRLDKVNVFLGKQDVLAGDKRINPALHIVYTGDMEHGGRLYSGADGHQSITDRSVITINGKRTVERDFACLHPHMIYAVCGKQFEGDAYDFCSERAAAKVAFQMALNCDSRLAAKLALQKWIADKGLDLEAEAILQAMEQRHEAVKARFYHCIGLELQNRDAKICLAVVERMRAMRIAALPVHDSFIVIARYDEQLQDMMHKAYADEMGFECRIK